jgi:hypothetical protein
MQAPNNMHLEIIAQKDAKIERLKAKLVEAREQNTGSINIFEDL